MNQLAFVRTIVQNSRLGGRIANFILRQPNHRLLYRHLGYHRTIHCKRAEKRIRFYMQNFRRRQPVALVIGHKNFSIRANANAVRCAQTTRNELNAAVFFADAHHFTPIEDLRTCTCTTRHDRNGQSHIKIIVFVHDAKGKLMEIRRSLPTLGKTLVFINNIVLIFVDKSCKLLFLKHIDVTIHYFYTQRFRKSLGNAFYLDFFRIAALHIFQHIHRTHGIPGTHHQTTIR